MTDEYAALRAALERILGPMEAALAEGIVDNQTRREGYTAAKQARLALSSTLAPSPEIDVRRLIRAVQISRNHDRDPAHRGLCLCAADAKLIAAAYREQADE